MTSMMVWALLASVMTYEVNAAASAAAPVAEGAAKAESSPEWAAMNTPVVKLAHWVSITDEVMADVPGFAQVLSGELIGGLVLAESGQLLNRDGTGAEMTGILANANIQAQAGAGTNIDEIAAAITKLRTVGFTEPDAVVLHPDDWNSAEIYVREAPMLFADPYTLAISNRTRVVAETRLALAVTRPRAFCSVVVNTA